jgi:hypothetical protein
MKKIGLIALALILAVGMLGIGYAYFTETLEITADVEAGDFKVCFVDSCCMPDCSQDGYWIKTELIDTNDDLNKNLLEITVGNYYQCAWILCCATIQNTGTIAAHTNLSILSVDPHLMVMAWPIEPWMSPEDLDPEELQSCCPPTCFLKPQEEQKYAILIHNSFDPHYDIEELATYKFQLEIVAEQFNAGPLWGPPAGPGKDIIENGSFEAPFIPWWSLSIPPGGSAQRVTTHTGDMGKVYYPVDGNKFALVKTDGPGSLSIVSQSFAMYPGMRIKGWAFFDSRDWYPPYQDYAQVLIKDATGAVVATPWYEDSTTNANPTPYDVYWDGPWTEWWWEAELEGTYYVELQITNCLDSLLDSMAGFDAIKSW